MSFRVAFAVESTVTLDDTTAIMVTWDPVLSGKMVCDPSVGGKTVAHTESLKNGQARLSFVVPKTAKGKLLTVKVKITATEPKSGKTVSAAKVAKFRVR